MHPLDGALTCFAAWNRRDPAALVATLTQGVSVHGKIADPYMTFPARGEVKDEIRSYLC
jgi:hypothetical protein